MRSFTTSDDNFQLPTSEMKLSVTYQGRILYKNYCCLLLESMFTFYMSQACHTILRQFYHVLGSAKVRS